MQEIQENAKNAKKTFHLPEIPNSHNGNLIPHKKKPRKHCTSLQLSGLGTGLASPNAELDTSSPNVITNLGTPGISNLETEITSSPNTKDLMFKYEFLTNHKKSTLGMRIHHTKAEKHELMFFRKLFCNSPETKTEARSPRKSPRLKQRVNLKSPERQRLNRYVGSSSNFNEDSPKNVFRKEKRRDLVHKERDRDKEREKELREKEKEIEPTYLNEKYQSAQKSSHPGQCHVLNSHNHHQFLSKKLNYNSQSMDIGSMSNGFNNQSGHSNNLSGNSNPRFHFNFNSNSNTNANANANVNGNGNAITNANSKKKQNCSLINLKSKEREPDNTQNLFTFDKSAISSSPLRKKKSVPPLPYSKQPLPRYFHSFL